MLRLLVDSHHTVRRAVYSELLTGVERVMLAKRILMVYLLTKNAPVRSISSHLKVSMSTVQRYQSHVRNGSYTTLAGWLTPAGIGKRVMNFLDEVASEILSGEHMTVSRALRRREGRSK